MVGSRCKLVVKAEPYKLDPHPITVNLGKVEILENNIENEKETLV